MKPRIVLPVIAVLLSSAPADMRSADIDMNVVGVENRLKYSMIFE